MPTLIRAAATAAVLAACALPAAAQWTDNPSVNSLIATGPAEQILPKIGAAQDGTSWIGWFENDGSGYKVKVQRLSASGAPMFPGGLLVSDKPQQTFLTDWDLICDSAGGVALVFSDIRDGNLEVQAYRVMPDGSFAWGPDGVQLSQSVDFNPSPRITETSDGQFVAVWGRSPSGSVPGDIRMQRLTADGQVLLGAGGMAVVGPTGTEKPGFCDVVPSLGGSVIVSWLRNTASFASPRHLYAMRYDVAGSNMWTNPTIVFDLGSLPIGYYPRTIPDGSGGAVLAWHASIANEFNAYAQRVTSAGVEVFPHNGLSASAVAGEFEMSPDVAYQQAEDVIWLVYHTRNSNQNRWGASTQRFDGAGNRLLGPTGAVIRPLDAFEDRSPEVTYAQGSGEIVAAWFDFPTGSVVDGRVVCVRIAEDGSFVWAVPPSDPAEPGLVPANTTLSSKDDLVVALDGCGRTLMTWQDNRSGGADVLAQNVNRNGTLGEDCPMDINGDGMVTFGDLNTLLGNYGQSAAPGALPGDADCDGTIGFPDLNLLLGSYGQAC
ncbi:MAG: hypothetical protein IBJ10_00455 [Phycisphaerales bacterium]|nr:hypothetical protein [Phycisphaerales bacterium]